MDLIIAVTHPEHGHRFPRRMFVASRVHTRSLHLNGPTMYQSCCTPGSAVSTYSNLPRERYMMMSWNEESKRHDLAGNGHGTQRLRVAVVHVIVTTIPWGRTQAPTFSDGCSLPLESIPTLSISRINYAPIGISPATPFQVFKLAREKVHDDELGRRKQT